MFSRALGRRLSGATRGALRRFPVLGIRDFQLLLADRLLAPAAYAFSLVGVSFAVLDATGLSKQAGLHVEHLTVSASGSELQGLSVCYYVLQVRSNYSVAAVLSKRS